MTTRRRSGRPTIRGTRSTACPTIPLPAPTWSTGSGTADGSRCRVRRRIPPRCPTSHRRPGPRRPSTPIRRRAGCPTRCRRPSANGCRSTSTIRSPTPPSRSRPSATAVGAQVRRIEVSTVNGTSTLRFDQAGKPLTVALPYGETPWVRITAIGHRRRVGRRAVRHHRLHRHAVRRERLRPSRQPAPHRGGARAATEFGCGAMGSGIGAARPARLRRGPRRHAVRRVDGALAGGAGEPEPDADGAVHRPR